MFNMKLTQNLKEQIKPRNRMWQVYRYSAFWFSFSRLAIFEDRNSNRKNAICIFCFVLKLTTINIIYLRWKTVLLFSAFTLTKQVVKQVLDGSTAVSFPCIFGFSKDQVSQSDMLQNDFDSNMQRCTWSHSLFQFNLAIEFSVRCADTAELQRIVLMGKR